MTNLKDKHCAYCGAVVKDSYFIVGDNFLQVKYFDSAEDNVFCTTECLCNSLSVLEIEVDNGDN